jgi:hypothetical protein
MKYLSIALLLFIGTVANAQSPFKPEPKVILKANPFAHATISQPDSFYNAWRFSANIAGYNYTFGNGGGSSAVSALEYGYEHQKWNYVTGAWDVLWSINGAWIPINTSLPLTWANMQTAAVTFGFKNPIPVGNSVIQIGPDFNPHAPKNQQFGLFATVGILLN